MADVQTLEWNCPTCTFLNVGGSGMCNVCHSFNPNAFSLLQQNQPTPAPTHHVSDATSRSSRTLEPVITIAQMKQYLTDKDIDVSGPWDKSQTHDTQITFPPIRFDQHLAKARHNSISHRRAD